MKLAIGLITYNEASSKYLPDFLASLFRAIAALKSVDCHVYIRDNSEQENNANQEYLLKNFNDNDRLSFTWSGTNLGFSKAYNLMITEAKSWGAEYFFMINPDTFIATDALAKMLQVISSQGQLASVAPKIRRWDFINKKFTNYLDSCGLIIKPGLVFEDIGQGLIDDGSYDHLAIIGPSGAAGLFRMSALESIKDKNAYLDEDMFMYKEDCDLAYRLSLKGYQSALVSEAIVYHDRSVAVSGQGLKSWWQGRQAKSKQVKSWSFLNQHLLIIKHWSKQSLTSKIRILARLSLLWLYALSFEPFLLKNVLIIRKKIGKKGI